MTNGPPSFDYVEMRFGPRWTYISCVRKFVASFFMIGLADKERAEQISMAVSELLENAVKYASDQRDGYLRIAIQQNRSEVDVCVKNLAEPHQINILRREFALVHAGDPESVYLAKMQEAAANEEQSRLGFARIRFESGARLELETTDDEVTIHAIFSLEQT